MIQNYDTIPPEDEGPSPEASLRDIAAERAVLAALMLDATLFDSIIEVLLPDHYAIDKHQTLARGIALTRQRSPTIDIITLASTLKEIGRLEQAGGTRYIAELMDETPSITREHVLEYARIVRKHWESRACLAHAQLLEAQIKTGSIEDIPRAFVTAAEQVSTLVRREIEELGFWGTELGALVDEPERETWLLWDTLANKPALPIGRAAMLSASGGTGKTTSLVQLSIAAALGLEWCGFQIKTPGCVCLCCGESDKKLMQRQLWRAMNSFGLDATQREDALRQILLLPLAGKEVNMLRGVGGDLERSEFLTTFRNRLLSLARAGNFLWSLIALDPLARFAGSDTESNNAAATQFAQAVETLCTLPGDPAIVCAHHSSKDSIRSGRNDSRGVSGLRDAFRAVMTLTRHRAETIIGVLMECDKSNEAPHFETRWLVQLQGDCGGCLRLATDAEAEVLQESAKKKKRVVLSAPPTMAELATPSDPRDAIVAMMEKHDGKAQSRRWLVERIPGFRDGQLYDAMKALLNEGVIITGTLGKHKQAIYLAGPELQEQLKGFEK